MDKQGKPAREACKERSALCHEDQQGGHSTCAPNPHTHSEITWRHSWTQSDSGKTGDTGVGQCSLQIPLWPLQEYNAGNVSTSA